MSDYPDPPRQPAWPFFAALGAAALVALSCGLAVLIGAIENGGRAPPTQDDASSASAVESEQAVIQAYISENANDPSSVEIVKWGDRRVYGAGESFKPGTVSVQVKVRGRNGFGAIMLYNHTFWVYEGKVIRTSP